MFVDARPGDDRPVLLHESNVERQTVSRFYGYTLEDPGPLALKQLDPYLEPATCSRPTVAIDYADRLDAVTTPTLMVAGEGDVMADIPSTQLTFDGLGQRPTRPSSDSAEATATSPTTATATSSGADTPPMRSSPPSSTGSTVVNSPPWRCLPRR